MKLRPPRFFMPAVDPEGRRLLGRTMQSGAPIFGIKGSSSTYAPSGAGKTTKVAMPALFSFLASEPEKAILISDPKDGEICAQALPMALALGRKVVVIDPFGIRPECAEYCIDLNPLNAAIATWEREPTNQLYANEMISHALIEEPSDQDMRNFYYRESPRSLIQFGISALLKRSTALTTPGAVAALISDIDMLTSIAEIETKEGHPALQTSARDVLKMRGQEHFNQHASEAMRALRHFGPGTRLEETGRKATLTHEDLIREGYVVFLVGPMRIMSRLGITYSLHLGAFTQALYQNIGSLRVIADEYTNTPVKNLLGEAITTIRSYGGEFHLIAQSRSEVLRKFGEHLTQTIEDNCAVKQYLAFGSPKEAEETSKAMGEEFALSKAVSGDTEGWTTQTNLSMVRQRHLSASDLLALPRDQQLIHAKGVGFFLARTISQENIAPFNKMLAPNPLEGGRLKPDTKITLTTSKVTS